MASGAHLVFLVAFAPCVALAQPVAPLPGQGIAPVATQDTDATPTTPARPSADAPIADAPRPVAPKVTYEPFGYLRLQYKVVQNDPYVEFVGRDDGFELQHARFGVRGKLGDRVAYKFALDGAIDERAQVNTPDGKLRVGLKDAYGDIALGQGVGSIAARAGYFETLVDPDLDDDTAREFVDKPLESRGVRPTQGFQTEGLTPGRSLGAALRIDPTPSDSGNRIGFELAVQNGADEYASNNDNDTPAVSLSGLARLPHGGYLVASGRYNRRTNGELPLRRDEDDLQGTVGGRFVAGPLAAAGGLVLVRTTYPTTGGPSSTAYGAHAQLMISLGAALPIGVGYRFGLLDPSSLIVTDRVMEHTLGVVLGVPSARMRFQLQVTHVQEQGARTLRNDRAQLAAELAL